LNKKPSDKDIKDWKDFISNKDKLFNKDLLSKNEAKRNHTKKIDLHGYTLLDANKAISECIKKCFSENTFKIIVITGKGLRSNNESNPYISKKLSILKYSIPEFIKSKKDLMQMILKITDADLNDGGGGAFYIYLKKFKE
jgi:DNA-nicking Smr family endonuclease|tara:strand:- start:1025 stop:1444 length:420 start_codon:yes stop_codon:yes gene_type:complete